MKYEVTIQVAIVIAAFVFFRYSKPEDVGIYSWLALTVGLLMLFHIIPLGREIAEMRKESTHAKLRKESARYLDALDTHRLCVQILTGCMLVGIVGIEIAVKRVGGLWGSPELLSVHLMLAIGSFVVFIFARWYTGTRKAIYHRRCVYTFSVLYPAAYVTGTILLNQKFPLLP